MMKPKAANASSGAVFRGTSMASPQRSFFFNRDTGRSVSCSNAGGEKTDTSVFFPVGGTRHLPMLLIAGCRECIKQE